MDPVFLNAKVIRAIKDILPAEVSLSATLMDVLPINKESVYRRLRGEVVFSFYELSIIARKLGISLDALIRTEPGDNAIFELIEQQYQAEEGNLSVTTSKFETILSHVLQDPASKFELSHNLFPQVPAHLFYYLSKYNSFKWVYKNGEALSFKEIDYPHDIFRMHRNNNLATMEIKETSYIWDHTIVEMMVREIQYYNEINLLDKEDVLLLKEDLHKFLFYVDRLAREGVFPTGNKVNIYISSVSTDAAYSYLESEKYRLCMIGAFDFQYVMSTDNVAYEIMKRKMHSLKRGAIQISESNENYRLSFFRKQHELVDQLD